MRLRINLDTIREDGNKIFGIIYLENEEIVFPEENWTDFVIIILNWWTKSLMKLIKGESFTENFDFMDGPLSIKINYIKEGEFDFYFLKKDSLVNKAKVDVSYFYPLFIKELNALLRFLNSKNMVNEEIKNLEHNHKQLQKEFRRYSNRSN